MAKYITLDVEAIRRKYVPRLAVRRMLLLDSNWREEVERQRGWYPDQAPFERLRLLAVPKTPQIIRCLYSPRRAVTSMLRALHHGMTP